MRRVLQAMGMPDRAAALLGLALLVTPAVGVDGAKDERKMVVKSESFDKDPGWEGHNNRLRPEVVPTVTQDYGYSDTQFAGTGKGEVGGAVVRCAAATYYAARVEKSLNDRLSASGTFAL